MFSLASMSHSVGGFFSELTGLRVLSRPSMGWATFRPEAERSRSASSLLFLVALSLQTHPHSGCSTCSEDVILQRRQGKGVIVFPRSREATPVSPRTWMHYKSRKDAHCC